MTMSRVPAVDISNMKHLHHALFSLAYFWASTKTAVACYVASESIFLLNLQTVLTKEKLIW